MWATDLRQWQRSAGSLSRVEFVIAFSVTIGGKYILPTTVHKWTLSLTNKDICSMLATPYTYYVKMVYMYNIIYYKMLHIFYIKCYIKVVCAPWESQRCPPVAR